MNKEKIKIILWNIILVLIFCLWISYLIFYTKSPQTLNGAKEACQTTHDIPALCN